MYIQERKLTDEYDKSGFPMRDLQDALDLKSIQRKEQETQNRLQKKTKDEEVRLKEIEWKNQHKQ